MALDSSRLFSMAQPVFVTRPAYETTSVVRATDAAHRQLPSQASVGLVVAQATVRPHRSETLWWQRHPRVDVATRQHDGRPVLQRQR